MDFLDKIPPSKDATVWSLVPSFDLNTKCAILSILGLLAQQYLELISLEFLGHAIILTFLCWSIFDGGNFYKDPLSTVTIALFCLKYITLNEFLGISFLQLLLLRQSRYTYFYNFLLKPLYFTSCFWSSLWWVTEVLVEGWWSFKRSPNGNRLELIPLKRHFFQDGLDWLERWRQEEQPGYAENKEEVEEVRVRELRERAAAIEKSRHAPTVDKVEDVWSLLITNAIRTERQVSATNCMVGKENDEGKKLLEQAIKEEAVHIQQLIDDLSGTYETDSVLNATATLKGRLTAHVEAFNWKQLKADLTECMAKTRRGTDTQRMQSLRAMRDHRPIYHAQKQKEREWEEKIATHMLPEMINLMKQLEFTLKGTNLPAEKDIANARFDFDCRLLTLKYDPKAAKEEDELDKLKKEFEEERKQAEAVQKMEEQTLRQRFECLRSFWAEEYWTRIMDSQEGDEVRYGSDYQAFVNACDLLDGKCFINFPAIEKSKCYVYECKAVKTLGVCRHNVEKTFRGSGVYSPDFLAQQVKLWHPGNFLGNGTDDRVEMAQEFFELLQSLSDGPDITRWMEFYNGAQLFVNWFELCCN
jgi:hypothetical protein